MTQRHELLQAIYDAYGCPSGYNTSAEKLDMGRARYIAVQRHSDGTDSYFYTGESISELIDYISDQDRYAPDHAWLPPVIFDMEDHSVTVTASVYLRSYTDTAAEALSDGPIL